MTEPIKIHWQVAGGNRCGDLKMKAAPRIGDAVDLGDGSVLFQVLYFTWTPNNAVHDAEMILESW